MAHFYPQHLLLLVLLMVVSECRDISVVTASQEEDAVLPCYNSNELDPGSCFRVKWTKCATDGRQTQVILARPKTPKIQDAERGKWEADGNGQMSLFLTKLQKSDEGLYSCEIWQGWDCVFIKNISLKVKECKLLQAVKAAPGTPVNLSCPVNLTSGRQGFQDISWVMLKGSRHVPVHSETVEINGTSLTIRSVNGSDSGWYRCKYMLGQTQLCFETNLQVQAENAAVTTTIPALTTSEIVWKSRKEGSSGAFIAVVASTITVFVITAALIGIFIYCRRITQRTAHPAESVAVYAIVNHTPSDDPTNQRINSLYEQIQAESLRTFQY